MYDEDIREDEDYKPLFVCDECGIITDEPKIDKDFVEVGDQILCSAIWYSCPRCGYDLVRYAEREVD